MCYTVSSILEGLSVSEQSRWRQGGCRPECCIVSC